MIPPMDDVTGKVLLPNLALDRKTKHGDKLKGRVVYTVVRKGNAENYLEGKFIKAHATYRPVVLDIPCVLLCADVKKSLYIELPQGDPERKSGTPRERAGTWLGSLCRHFTAPGVFLRRQPKN